MIEYAKHYNSLPSIEDSAENLNQSSYFVPFLEDAEEVVVRYELEPYVGLRIIHSHFFVEPTQIMGKKYQLHKGQPSLVTSAHEVDEAVSQMMIPSSWILTCKNGGERKIFEASNDEAVHTGSQIIQKNLEFLDEMEKLLENNELNNLLAVSILRRDALVASENQVYLETNDGKTEESIVQVWDVSKRPSGTIRTSWSFKGPRQQDCIRQIDCYENDKLSGHSRKRYHLKT